MSLIHDALKEMDLPAVADDGSARVVASLATPKRHLRVLPTVVAFAGVLALGGVAYAGWQTLRPKPEPALAVVVPALAAPIKPVVLAGGVPAVLAAEPGTPVVAGVAVPVMAPVTVAMAAVEPSALATSDAVAAASSINVASVSSAPPAAPAPMRVAAIRPRTALAEPRDADAFAPVQVATAEPRPARQSVEPAPWREARPAKPERADRLDKAGRGALDTVSPEERFSLFLQAMQGRNNAEAERQLSSLRMQLTRSSVSLLRAEAWFASANGDSVRASREYQEIIERLPGDEEASINLAAIEAGLQHTERARQILADALSVYPESAPLKSTLARFKGTQ